MIDVLVSSKAPRRRPELLHKYPWPARSPNGSINAASMLDIKAWYVEEQDYRREIPGRAVWSIHSYIDCARARSSGRSSSQNKDSKLPAAVD